MRRVWLHVLGALVGGVLGYLGNRFVSCSDCLIVGSPFLSVFLASYIGLRVMEIVQQHRARRCAPREAAVRSPKSLNRAAGEDTIGGV